MKSILWWAFLAFVFSIPISQFVSVRILVIVAVLSALTYSRQALMRLATRSWDVLAYLVMLAIGLLYTDNLRDGWSVLETSVSLLAVPLVFSRLDDLDPSRLNLVFAAFACGLLAAVTTGLVNAVNVYSDSGEAQAFFFENFTSILNLQPTYLAYYLIFTIGYGLFLAFYGTRPGRSLAIVVAMTFFFVILMLSGGKTALISFVLILAFFILKYLIEDRSGQKHIVFAGVCFMVIALFSVQSISLWMEDYSVQSDYWERSALWKSAMSANPQPVFGVGTGDYKTILNEYYVVHGLTEYAVDSYNAHNQFIHVYFTNGILGLLCCLLMMGRPLYSAFRSQDPLSVLIMFPFFVYGMTEVFLGRYQGVVFFALLHQISTYRAGMMSPSLFSKVP